MRSYILLVLILLVVRTGSSQNNYKIVKRDIQPLYLEMYDISYLINAIQSLNNVLITGQVIDSIYYTSGDDNWYFKNINKDVIRSRNNKGLITKIESSLYSSGWEKLSETEVDYYANDTIFTYKLDLWDTQTQSFEDSRFAKFYSNGLLIEEWFKKDIIKKDIPVSIDPYRITYDYYDTLCYLLKSKITYKLQNNEWVYRYKELLSYNSYDDIKNVEYLEWDNVTWKKAYKDEYTYNDDHLQLTQTQYIWGDISSQYELSNKIINEYDTSNYLMKVIYSRWDNNSNDWIKTRRYFYERDQNGNILSDYYENKIDNEWSRDLKNNYTYTSHDLLSTYVLTKWNYETNKWDDVYTYNYEYNNIQNIVKYSFSHWDTSSNSWINDSYQDYIYNLNNNLEFIESYIWNDTLYRWDYSKIRSYIYNENENLIQESEQLFSDVINEWIHLYKNDYYLSYNSSGLLYLEGKQMSIYPNPSKGIISIELEDNMYLNKKLEVYSINGLLIKRIDLENKRDIKLLDLTPGIYIIRVEGYTSERIIII